MDGRTIVVDVGKTNAKLSLRDEQGRLLAEQTRPNAVVEADGYRALDAAGIESWLLDALADLAGQGPVRRIVPVGHGAAAALIEDDRLYALPVDYETEPDAGERAAYAAERDDFAATGSPLLPATLNLGMQLFHLEALRGPLPDAVRILPWPQYWAWRLSGVMASEVTSLGCHSDLWQPLRARCSLLAERRGWAARLAPLRRADAVLAPLRPSVAAGTGLPPDCEVVCGLHDSNAALLAMRGHAETAGRDATVLSTGTWFVAMRSPAASAGLDPCELAEDRDCLVNVDIDSRPVPSARFMGGREAEVIRGPVPPGTGDDPAVREAGRLRLRELLATGFVVLPSFVDGVGPYPDAAGRLEPPLTDARDRQLAASLYLALMSAAVLDLIGARDCLLVEGPFADDDLFVSLLAALRPGLSVHTGAGRHDLAYGALRLVEPGLAPPSVLRQRPPLDVGGVDLAAYAADWRQQAVAAQQAA